MCVSCDLFLHSLSFIHLSLSSSSSVMYHAIENFPSLALLLSHFLFYMIKDTFLLFHALFYVIEDVPFPCSTFDFTSKWWLHVHVCMCASVGYFSPIFFFPPFEEGLRRVSRYTSRTSHPLENSTFLWLLSHHSFVPCTLSFAFFCRSYPFDVSFPPARPFE